jgi:hypothetical protein
VTVLEIKEISMEILMLTPITEILETVKVVLIWIMESENRRPRGALNLIVQKLELSPLEFK